MSNTNAQEQLPGDNEDDQFYSVNDEESDAFTSTSTQKENLMDSAEWPSLLTGLASPNPSDTSWEMVSPSAHQNQHRPAHGQTTTRMPPASVPTLTDEPLIDDTADDAVVINLPPKHHQQESLLARQRSFSAPDFIHLEGTTTMTTQEGDDDGLSDNHHHDDQFPYEHDDSHRTYPPSTTSTSAWGGLSFRDIVMSQMHGLADEVVDNHQQHQQSPLALSNKPKPRFVVTPVPMRRHESSPNLSSLGSNAAAAATDDSNLILGDSDAMEFYHRKAKGYTGRKNGFKMRPDEAKRLSIIMHKKELQRQTVAS